MIAAIYVKELLIILYLGTTSIAERESMSNFFRFLMSFLVFVMLLGVNVLVDQEVFQNLLHFLRIYMYKALKIITNFSCSGIKGAEAFEA